MVSVNGDVTPTDAQALAGGHREHIEDMVVSLEYFLHKLSRARILSDCMRVLPGMKEFVGFAAVNL
jgi:hypothetical protein